MTGGEGTRMLPALAVPKPLRTRHDGFTPRKKRRFFKALRKTGCVTDACRKAGISRETVRRHRIKWPDFEAAVQEALGVAATVLEAIAWQRATIGAEEKIYRDGRLVYVRVKPSDSMLRLLMQGTNPAKYGRTGQMPKGLALERLRKEALKAARAELRAERPSKDESIAELMSNFEKWDEEERAAKLKRGYTEGPERLLVPPGWRIVRDGAAPGAGAADPTPTQHRVGRSPEPT